MSQIVAPHIELRPGAAGSRLRIVGKGVLVHAVAVWNTVLHMSPEEIAKGYDLTLAEVYAALSFYHDHKDELDAVIREEDRHIAEMKAKSPSILQQRIRERFGA
jgi:uncharacterized protein (DUF433 family)